MITKTKNSKRKVKRATGRRVLDLARRNPPLPSHKASERQSQPPFKKGGDAPSFQKGGGGEALRSHEPVYSIPIRILTQTSAPKIVTERRGYLQKNSARQPEAVAKTNMHGSKFRLYSLFKRSMVKLTIFYLIVGLNWAGISAIGRTSGFLYDTENSLGNSYQAGTLNFSLYDTSDTPLASPLFNISAMSKGETQQKTVRVKKMSGSLDFQYKVSIANAAGDLCPYLNLKAVLDTSEKYNNIVQINTTFPTTALLYSDPNDDWTFDLTLSGTAPESKTCAFDLVFSGTQNADGTGFSSTKTISNTATSGTWQTCKTWTTQAEFESTTRSNIDTATSPGDAQLTGTPGSKTLILRPNQDGDSTVLSRNGGSNNYDRVNEASNDGDGTYVSSSASTEAHDLYNLPDLSQTGTINYVVAHSRMRQVANSSTLSGPNNSSTFVNDSTVGSIDWVNPVNAQSSNGIYATASLKSPWFIIYFPETSHYLKANNFNFNIPSGAEIKGIEVKVEKSADASNKIVDNSVKLIKNGSITGNNEADTSTGWETTNTPVTYGGPADLWGVTWTPSDINNTATGIAFSAKHTSSSGPNTAKIDYISMTVYYTTPAAGRTYIEAHGSEFGGDWKSLTTSYTDYLQEYPNNPQTGLVWTWDEINALQTGASFQNATGEARATQVWVDVNYNGATYNTPGTLESQGFDAGEVADWQSLEWSENLPSGTDITLQASTSNNGSTWSSWYPVPASSNPQTDLTSLTDTQFIKWKASLTTSDTNNTPVLHEVRVCYSLTGQNIWKQTTQTDFGAGTPNNVDTSTNPDNIQLATTGGSGTITIRPNAEGDYLGLSEQGSDSYHWTKVDETPSDGDDTYVSRDRSSYARDLYNLENTTQAGAITSVKVFANVRVSSNADSGDNAYTVIKVNGIEYNGSVVNLTTTYAATSTNYVNNPQTGNTWTWAEIDALQAGVALHRSSDGSARCTQVWVDVNYSTSAYNTSGTLESQSFDGGAMTDWQSLEWDDNTPAGTDITLEVATSNNGSTWSAWQLLSGASPISLTSLPETRYIKWKATLTTSDTSKTPMLSEVRVIYYPGAALEHIVLNEFLPNPSGTTPDYGFDFGEDNDLMPKGEWVEIYNKVGGKAVDLSGWKIKDKDGNIVDITSSNTISGSTIVGSEDWLVVYMNGEMFNNNGDTVYLYDPFNNLVDSHSYDLSNYCTLEPTPEGTNDGGTPSLNCPTEVPGNKSYARIPDGVGAWVDPIPTPGESNNSSVVPEPVQETVMPEEILPPAEEPESQTGITFDCRIDPVIGDSICFINDSSDFSDTALPAQETPVSEAIPYAGSGDTRGETPMETVEASETLSDTPTETPIDTPSDTIEANETPEFTPTAQPEVPADTPVVTTSEQVTSEQVIETETPVDMPTDNLPSEPAGEPLPPAAEAEQAILPNNNPDPAPAVTADVAAGSGDGAL